MVFIIGDANVRPWSPSMKKVRFERINELARTNIPICLYIFDFHRIVTNVYLSIVDVL